MAEVKSLNVTADTYRHRGWMWRDRATYELFKAHMKLPLWIDRVLTDGKEEYLYVVGKEDGHSNTIHVGSFRAGVHRIPALFEAHRAQYNCRNVAGNGFVVLAERIRAKKPDVNKAPRPLWRQRMTKPWEPGTLGGKWVLDSKLVSEVSLNVVVPERADRLYISTSGGTDTLVWADSTTLKSTLGRAGSKSAWAQGVVGIKGYRLANDYSYDTVLLHEGCHWQLAGVRKKTVRVPRPEVVEPAPVELHGTDSGRIPHLNPLLAASYGTRDIYKELAESLGVSRSDAKVRLFRDLYTPQPLGKSIIFDFSHVDFAKLERLAAAHHAPKPPIGVKPRNLHDEERANALDAAMVRYLNEDLPFPTEWATEWNELRARLNKEQK